MSLEEPLHRHAATGSYMLDGYELVAALSTAAQQLSAPRGEDETLAAVVAAAVQAVPGVEQAGLSLIHGDGTITSQHPSSDVIATVDQLQATYREGPCVTSLREEQMVVVDDLAIEASRWPRFAPEAVSYGVSSMLSFQLFARKDTMGALNLYSGRSKAFTEESQTIGGLFAAQASIALSDARNETDMRHALATRDVIAQGKGILMERFGVDADDAFAMLVHSSQTTNIKLVEIARWLIGDIKSQTRNNRTGRPNTRRPGQ